MTEVQSPEFAYDVRNQIGTLYDMYQKTDHGVMVSDLEFVKNHTSA